MDTGFVEVVPIEGQGDGLFISFQKNGRIVFSTDLCIFLKLKEGDCIRFIHSKDNRTNMYLQVGESGPLVLKKNGSKKFTQNKPFYRAIKEILCIKQSTFILDVSNKPKRPDGNFGYRVSYRKKKTKK